MGSSLTFEALRSIVTEDERMVGAMTQRYDLLNHLSPVQLSTVTEQGQFLWERWTPRGDYERPASTLSDLEMANLRFCAKILHMAQLRWQLMCKLENQMLQRGRRKRARSTEPTRRSSSAPRRSRSTSALAAPKAVIDNQFTSALHDLERLSAQSGSEKDSVNDYLDILSQAEIETIQRALRELQDMMGILIESPRARGH